MDDRPSIDDEDFDYGDEPDSSNMDSPEAVYQGTGRSTMVQNQPHDEEVSLSDTGSHLASPDAPPSHRGPPTPTAASGLEDSRDEYEMGPSQQQQQQQQEPAAEDRGTSRRSRTQTREYEADTAADAEDMPGAYNALDYKHLNVSEEVRDLFKYIGRYKPYNVELETRLRPFIPDYIPAVGSIDEFIKVPRPDGRPDFLGLKVLDEPATKQSDPTVLNLQLRQVSKDAPGATAEVVGRIEHADAMRGKKLQQWITSAAEIQRGKPSATVTHSHPMPDMEVLMQEWPPEMEAALQGAQLPNGDLDVDLLTYVKMVCALLDIPVYNNPIESLQLLFGLYLEFKNIARMCPGCF